MAQGVRKPLTADRNTLAEEFFARAREKGCRIRFSDNGRSKTLDATVFDADGTPVNTVCFETFPSGTPDRECMAGVIDRLVRGELLFDNFEAFGVKDVHSYAELAIKMSVAGMR